MNFFKSWVVWLNLSVWNIFFIVLVILRTHWKFLVWIIYIINYIQYVKVIVRARQIKLREINFYLSKFRDLFYFLNRLFVQQNRLLFIILDKILIGWNSFVLRRNLNCFIFIVTLFQFFNVEPFNIIFSFTFCTVLV